MAIGEILLRAFLLVLFEKLVSLRLHYAQREGAPPFSGISILLLKWEKMLITINAVVDDVEDKKLSNEGPVKLWLDDVRNLAYDMEDLLDELAIEVFRAKSKAECSTSRGMVKSKFPFVSQHKSPILNLLFEIEVEKINDGLEEIVTRRAHLGLIENAMNIYDYNKRIPSCSLPERQLFGREKEEAELLEFLTGEAKNVDTTLSIVAIVGMAGVGKTALARRLYNGVKVCCCFEKRAWVSASYVFDALDLTKNILSYLTTMTFEHEDLNGLQVKLKDSLSGKKFLVVLDDIWNENYKEWTTFLKPFKAGAKGSKIIITTRDRTISLSTRDWWYPLKELSIDNCTSLLAFHALGKRNFERHPNLETIGKKIVGKYKCLPLAVKMLGGFLRNKCDPNEWEAVLDYKICDLLGEDDEVSQVLKLSYDHLPSKLKRCFAYCAIFPKDYEIDRDELVLLWMVNGIFDGLKEKLLVGWHHFDELVSKSFLQQSSVDTLKFSMHDLFNDLAKSIAGSTCFSSGESQPVDNEDVAALEKIRHASFTPSGYVTSKSLRAHAGMRRLRSLMLIHTGFGQGSKKFSISNEVMHDLLTKLKYLRVLSFCHCSIIEVPNIIGDLKHLRYINFSYTDIERLPESIGALCNLQALILRGCEKLSMLPLGIANSHMLSRLTHLEIIDCPALQVECFPPLPITLCFLRLDSCPKIKSLPNQWYHLTSLMKLEIKRCQNIECLPEGGWPPKLRELRISEFENLKRPVREWGLERLGCLKTLLIDLSMGCEGEKVWFPSEDKDAWGLLFPTSLTSLYIKNMRNVERLSSGLRNHLSSLRQLWIENCPMLRYLPEDGFPPNLQELHMLRRKLPKD